MPASIAMNGLTAAIAALGVATASFVGANGDAYGDGRMSRLSDAEAAIHAQMMFARADRDGDGALSVNEYAALSVVTAELANLNGFLAIEQADKVAAIALPPRPQAALGDAEQTRIDAVARSTFYEFSGIDGKLQQGEYLEMQRAIFLSSDLNANGSLANSELSIYAQRQAYLRPDA